VYLFPKEKEAHLPVKKIKGPSTCSQEKRWPTYL
jgi:hypothetical protein